jgi:hypothetical protein
LHAAAKLPITVRRRPYHPTVLITIAVSAAELARKLVLAEDGWAA